MTRTQSARSRNTYLPPWLFLLLFSFALLCCNGLGISVGRNVLLERGVFVCHGNVIRRVKRSQRVSTYRDLRCCRVPATTCGTSTFLHVSIEPARTMTTAGIFGLTSRRRHRCSPGPCRKSSHAEPPSWNSDAQVNGCCDGGVEIDAKLCKIEEASAEKRKEAGIKRKRSQRRVQGKNAELFVSGDCKWADSLELSLGHHERFAL